MVKKATWFIDYLYLLNIIIIFNKNLIMIIRAKYFK